MLLQHVNPPESTAYQRHALSVSTIEQPDPWVLKLIPDQSQTIIAEYRFTELYNW